MKSFLLIIAVSILLTFAFFIGFRIGEGHHYCVITGDQSPACRLIRDLQWPLNE